MKKTTQIKNAIKAFLVVISVSSIVNAQLVPGPPGGGPNRPAPYPGDRPGGGGPGPGNPGRPPYNPGRPPHEQPPYNPPYYPPSRPPYNPPSQPPYYPPAQPPYNPPGNPGYGSELKRVYISRDVWNETLNLRLVAGIGREYQGYEVLSVRVNARPMNSGVTTMQLISDGRVVASQRDTGYQVVLYPQSRLVLDQNVSTLQLAMNGRTYIDNIEIELRRNTGGYNPPPPGYGQNIEINIYRSVYGNDRIDLTPYIDMFRYRGRTIERIMITASSRSGGVIELYIDGPIIGAVQFRSGYSEVATFNLSYAVLGHNANNLVLLTRGELNLEHVTIVLR